MNLYFNWLLGIIDGWSDGDYEIHILEVLNSIPFYWSNKIVLDSARAEDALALRQSFADKNLNGRLFYDPYPFDGAVSVLEVLVALASRCETQIMSSSKHGNRTGLWFFIMINNLLDIKTEFNFDEDIKIKVKNWLDRNYLENGYGGLFPLRQPYADQRTIDIWSQMNAYLVENVAE